MNWKFWEKKEEPTLFPYNMGEDFCNKLVEWFQNNKHDFFKIEKCNDKFIWIELATCSEKTFGTEKEAILDAFQWLLSRRVKPHGFTIFQTNSYEPPSFKWRYKCNDTIVWSDSFVLEHGHSSLKICIDTWTYFVNNMF